MLAANLLLSTIVLPLSPAGAEQVGSAGTVVLSNYAINSAPEFAGDRYADPWDFSNGEDMSLTPAVAGYGLSNMSSQGGVLSASVSPGGYLVFAGGTLGALPLGRDSRLIPIDAVKYTRLSVRMYSDKADVAQIWWYRCLEPEQRCFGATQFRTEAGWQTYDVALVNTTGTQSPWAGSMSGIRLDPIASKGGNIQLDYLRLYQPTAAARVTLARSGGTGTGTVIVDPDRVAGNGNETAVLQDGKPILIAATANVAIDGSMLPQGSWNIGVRESNGGITYTPQPLVINGPPMPVVIDPDIGGGADFNEVYGGNPWDFTDGSGVLGFNNVVNARYTNGVLYAQNGGPNPADNQINLKLNQAIDGTRFHRMTVKIGYDGPFGLDAGPGGGMVLRTVWRVGSSPAAQDLNDVVVYPGDQTISVDLASSPPGDITDEGTSPQIGWTGQTITALRLDPNEDPANRAWRIDEIRIAEDDKGTGTFSVKFQDNNWAAGTVADIYVDRGGKGLERSNVAAGVPVTQGVNTYRWNLGNLPAGTYWVLVALRRGSTSASAFSTGPVQMKQLEAIGRVDAITQNIGSTLTIRGWALDPGVAGAATSAHIYVDGKGASVAANLPRADIGRIYPYGPNHGYQYTTGALSAGPHSICVYGYRGPAGPNPSLGCRTVSIAANPIGRIDQIAPITGGMQVRGWSLDPSGAASTPVHVYVDGKVTIGTLANRPRGDIANAYPGYGAAHGFQVNVPMTAGRHTVCVYGINSAPPGTNSQLGCQQVVTPSLPIGRLDRVSRAGNTLTFAGWVIDPRTSNPPRIHVYIDGVGAASLPVTLPRGDVAAAKPNFTVRTPGFSSSLTLKPGSHRVCFYAIGVNANALLSCHTV